MCVCGDPAVRRVVGDALIAAGLAIEHRAAVGAATPTDFAVVVVDRAARQAAGATLRTADVPVIVVGDDLRDDGLISLMLESRVSHLVGDPRDRDLGITSEKLVTGDVFGLEKYVCGDGAVSERIIASEVERRAAVAEVCAWAEGIGARRPVLHRLANVVDELVMNALHDAPREARPANGSTAVLRWACDDRVIAVSVADHYGELSQRDVITHVQRARHDRGRPRAQSIAGDGAGLGLYLVLANVASLIVNVAPGHRTEVVCLFDMSRRERRAVTSGVRSLHVFATG
jgi:hypothetical protein